MKHVFYKELSINQWINGGKVLWLHSAIGTKMTSAVGAVMGDIFATIQAEWN
jgi:hypothetical protein